jgi:hypothetical protein
MEAIKHTTGKIPGAAIVLVLFFAIGTPVHANVRFPAPVARAGKRVAWPVPELTPPGMQDVGVDLKRPRHFCDRGFHFQLPHGG